MAIQAAQRAPLPLMNQAGHVCEWVVDGDIRRVRLIRENENNLICQVFNQATNESSRRLIHYLPHPITPTLSDYARQISQTMRPELCSNRNGPTCTAMLVNKRQKLTNAWHAGLDGEIEVKIFQRPGAPRTEKFPCIVLDTASNKQKIFFFTRDQLEIWLPSNKSYQPIITKDADGHPHSIEFQEIQQVVVREPAPLLPSPTHIPPIRLPTPLELLPLERPIIQPAPGQIQPLNLGGGIKVLPPVDSPEWIVVKAWDLGNDKEVRLKRFEDNLSAVHGLGINAKVSPLEIPQGFTADEVVDELSTQRPFINLDGSVTFQYAEKSKLSDDVFVTEDKWAVTVADLNQCASDPISWGGHAVIVIESVDETGYKMRRADIVGVAKQDYPLLSNGMRKILLPEDFPRTKTFLRSKESVERMIAQIELEKIKFEEGNPLVFFNPMGGPGDRSERVYNCMEWAVKTISLANIRLVSGLGITTPSRHTGSRPLNVAKDVGAAVGISAIPAVGAGALALSAGAGITGAATATLVTGGMFLPVLLIATLVGTSFNSSK